MVLSAHWLDLRNFNDCHPSIHTRVCGSYTHPSTRAPKCSHANMWGLHPPEHPGSHTWMCGSYMHSSTWSFAREHVRVTRTQSPESLYMNMWELHATKHPNIQVSGCHEITCESKKPTRKYIRTSARAFTRGSYTHLSNMLLPPKHVWHSRQRYVGPRNSHARVPEPAPKHLHASLWELRTWQQVTCESK